MQAVAQAAVVSQRGQPQGTVGTTSARSKARSNSISQGISSDQASLLLLWRLVQLPYCPNAITQLQSTDEGQHDTHA